MGTIAKIDGIAIGDISKICGIAKSNFTKMNGMELPSGGWVGWDETTEAGLASIDIFVCMMKNTSAGGDETGQGGGLTGANLVLTESGTLAGATGTPPSRVFDGTDDCLRVTTTFLDTLLANANKTWTIIMKVSALTLAGDRFWYFQDNGSTEICSGYINTTTFEMAGNIEQDNTVEADLTVGNLSAATTYYICMWADGTKAYHGFTTTRPTKLSDFAANDRHLYTVNTGDFSGETFDHATYKEIGCSGASAFMGMTLHYIVMAKTCLIDNAA